MIVYKQRDVAISVPLNLVMYTVPLDYVVMCECGVSVGTGSQ